ncbi:MAG: hypothetical protein WBE34_16785, partial [Candidatus Nitrosopolaris sp.]
HKQWLQQYYIAAAPRSGAFHQSLLHEISIKSCGIAEANWNIKITDFLTLLELRRILVAWWMVQIVLLE